MDSGKMIFWGVLLVVAVMVIGIYNRLVSLRNSFKNAFAQIDVQLKRRHDLVPNLVESAKAYMKHERETLEAVITARNQAITAQQAASSNPANPQAMKSLTQAEGQLSAALGKMSVVFEQYPDLRASQNMGQLMEELASTENRISFARQAFNDAVMTYNTAREAFPSVLLAGAFGFQPATLFEIPSDTERQPIAVKF